MARGYWTFAQVQEYLGHSVPESTEVWLSRHRILPERLYRIKDVMEEREPNKAGTKTKRLRSGQ